MTLPAGDYGHVTVAATGTLVLTGGVYEVIDVITLGGSIRMSGATDLRLAQRLSLGNAAFLGPQSGSGVDASQIVVYVAGINGTPPARRHASAPERPRRPVAPRLRPKGAPRRARVCARLLIGRKVSRPADAQGDYSQHRRLAIRGRLHNGPDDHHPLRGSDPSTTPK